MNQYIGLFKQIFGEVAGTVTGISADQGFKAFLSQRRCDPERFPLESGRELESHPAYLAFT
jgi:hypothetical protein